MSEKVVNDAQAFKSIGTPAAKPPAGSLLAYFKVDGKLYKKDSAGVETEVNAGDGNHVYVTLKNGEAGAMAAGDVVVIDPAVDSGCIFSTTNKDTTVAGVVAVGGASGANIQVCTSGVIDTKVVGIVARGDSLSTSVTSTRAGTAGGAVNAVLGKALEANGAGNGTVKVLINLA